MHNSRNLNEKDRKVEYAKEYILVKLNIRSKATISHLHSGKGYYVKDKTMKVKWLLLQQLK